eukprot:6394428-Pyramimonas_sp.AAC.1
MRKAAAAVAEAGLLRIPCEISQILGPFLNVAGFMRGLRGPFRRLLGRLRGLGKCRRGLGTCRR